MQGSCSECSRSCNESPTYLAEEDTRAFVTCGLTELWLIAPRSDHSCPVFLCLLQDSCTNIQISEIAATAGTQREGEAKSEIKMLALSADINCPRFSLEQEWLGSLKYQSIFLPGSSLLIWMKVFWWSGEHHMFRVSASGLHLYTKAWISELGSART